MTAMQSRPVTGLQIMTTLRLVQYSTHPDHTAENRARVQAVIAELEQLGPTDFSYTVVADPDTNTFTHLVINEGGDNPLAELPAFAEFQRGLKDRVATSPTSSEVDLVGRYASVSDVTATAVRS